MSPLRLPAFSTVLDNNPPPVVVPAGATRMAFPVVVMYWIVDGTAGPVHIEDVETQTVQVFSDDKAIQRTDHKKINQLEVPAQGSSWDVSPLPNDPGHELLVYVDSPPAFFHEKIGKTASWWQTNTIQQTVNVVQDNSVQGPNGQAPPPLDSEALNLTVSFDRNGKPSIH